MTLFNEVDDQKTIDENKNYLEELVGEGRKFKSVEDLAKGKATSDLFIEQLQKELSEIRADLRARKTVEELLEKRTHDTTPPPPNNQAEDEQGDKLANLEAILEKKLAERDQLSLKQRNLNTVKETLQTAWGPRYSEQLLETARQLGVTPQYLDGLAQDNPSVFFRLVNVQRNTAETTVPDRTVVTTNSTPNTGVKGWSHFQKLRKELGDQYYSPKVQQEIWKSIEKLGEERFYNT